MNQNSLKYLSLIESLFFTYLENVHIIFTLFSLIFLLSISAYSKIIHYFIY